jgi:acyl-CoA reductase-like NAD-dependent aldehyde dehydrogenase
MSPSDRADALDRLSDALVARMPRMAAAIVDEAGFPATSAGPVHVGLAIEFLRYYARLIRGHPFEEARPHANVSVQIRRVPVGVVAAIAPWNIPILGALSKIAPALAAGCTVVFKPSPETPLGAYILAEATHEAGIPAGVLNILPANLQGSVRLTEHPDVDMIGFTGSTAVGKQIALACAAQLRRCALELGGNAAAIVLEDAPPSLLAGLAHLGLALNNGEACIAQRRILVPRARHDEIVGLLCTAAKGLAVGDPNTPGTMIGPMVSRVHQRRVLDYIEIGRAEGATVACGGRAPEGLEQGFYVEPTVLANVNNTMRVAREEIFGPVVCVIPYDSVEEAIAIAQDTEYGLSSSVWTADPDAGAEIGRRLRVGSLYVNATMTLDPAIPFGGFKHSGLGRENGPEGLAEYCELQPLFTPIQAPAAVQEGAT